jgi:hypothetical protein
MITLGFDNVVSTCMLLWLKSNVLIWAWTLQNFWDSPQNSLKETALWHQCQLEKMITHWSWGFAFSHIQLCPLQKSCKLIDLELQPGHQNCGPWSFCINPTHWNISLPRLINETKFTKVQNVMQIQKQFVEWAYLSWNTISLRTTLCTHEASQLVM